MLVATVVQYKNFGQSADCLIATVVEHLLAEAPDGR
jgi:hypothetical protein